MNIKSKVFVLLLFGLAMLVFVFTGCDSAAEEDPAADPEEAVEEEEDEAQVFTMDEIADYDGQDGNPAYIVVDGMVYDVTDVAQWAGAEHYGFEPGTDVTEALADAAPHGANQLNNAEVVGKIAD